MPVDHPAKKCAAASKVTGNPCASFAVSGGEFCKAHGGVSENPVPGGRKKRQQIRCKAHRTDGEPCKAWAVVGQLVCKRHGGNSPRARRATAMKAAEEKAAALLTLFGAPAPVVNSLEELQRLAGEIVGWKDACRKMVNDLHLKEIDLRYESSQRLEQIRSEVVLWERSLDRASTVLSSLVRLNLDERLVGVKEKTAENISAALAGALAKAGIDPDAANSVRREFSRALKVVEAA